MTTITDGYSETMVQVGSSQVHLMKAGSGRPLLLLQDDVGSPGWLPLYRDLAHTFEVYVPSHPGFGKSERPDWMRNVRDLAIAQLWLTKNLGLDSVSVVGLGFGGWVAAEMATMRQDLFNKMILVGAVGVQPLEGEIADQFLLSGVEYARLCFHDPSVFEAAYGSEAAPEQLETWEINREMTIRLAWKPYMFDQALPHLLGMVDTPTLVVVGDQDKVAPLSCAQRYLDLLPDARMETIENCGHCVDVEKPAELGALIKGFFAG